MSSHLPRRPADDTRKIGLVLQGGGALGSYQAGAYEALAEADYRPDWVAGISIGAINGAIIAGNAPADRADRLKTFWTKITTPAYGSAFIPFADIVNKQWHAASAMMFGQPGFFKPNVLAGWPGSTASLYDASGLRTTLEELVDFDRINAGETRLSVGATNVETGDFIYFDSNEMKLGPEHILASSALPPAFAPVEIAGKFYWDGGLVSNTPLQYMIDYVPRRSRLTFQIDLFNPNGPAPHDMDSILERQKDIQYSSRTRSATDMYRVIHDVRHNINQLLEMLSPELRKTTAARFLYEFGCVTRMDIVRLTYRPEIRQGQTKDYEFSPLTMMTRWEQGSQDALNVLRQSPWLQPMPAETGARVFDSLDPLAKRDAQTSLMCKSRTAPVETLGNIRKLTRSHD